MLLWTVLLPIAVVVLVFAMPHILRQQANPKSSEGNGEKKVKIRWNVLALMGITYGSIIGLHGIMVANGAGAESHLA